MTASSSAASVELVEVSPRDGLQDHSSVVPTEVKVELIRRAAVAGLRRVEVCSFAHPRVVPQMADAEAVVAATADLASGVRRIGLVLNERGLDRALDCGIDEINVVVLATETFSRRNQGVSVAESVAVWQRIAGRAAAAGLPASVTVSAAFGCPYEGEVVADSVLAVVDQVAAGAPTEITLADTIGVAVPDQVASLVGAARSATGRPIRLHLHDTRGTALANGLAGIAAGATALDASLGGLGGCPFAPGATGNVATEDLAWALGRSGIATGVDPALALDAARWAVDAFGAPGGHLAGVAPFPPAA